MVILTAISFWTTTAYGVKPVWTLDNYRTIFGNYVYVDTFLRTLRIAGITTVLTLLAAYPMAFALSRLTGVYPFPTSDHRLVWVSATLK